MPAIPSPCNGNLLCLCEYVHPIKVINMLTCNSPPPWLVQCPVFLGFLFDHLILHLELYYFLELCDVGGYHPH